MTWLSDLRDRRRCRRAEPMLLRFLDGELGPGQAQRVAEHLAACERCCADASVWRAVRERLGDLRVPADPGSLLRLEQLVEHLTHATH